MKTTYKSQLYISVLAIFSLYGCANISNKNNGTWFPVSKSGLGVGSISSITEFNGKLYAANPCPGCDGTISELQDTTWKSIGDCSGTLDIKLFSFGNELYVGGAEGFADNTLGNVIFKKWDGKKWYSLTKDLSKGEITDFAIFNDKLYVSGFIENEEQEDIGFVAGCSKEELNGKIGGDDGKYDFDRKFITRDLTYFDGVVGTLTVYKGELYAGGKFNSIPGYDMFYALKNHHIETINIKNIARYDLNGQWSSVGEGVDNSVLTMSEFNNELYVGGSFVSSGNLTLNRIGKWNGSRWDTVSSGMNNDVNALKVYKGKLYIGGDFNYAGSKIINHISTWDGNKFENVGKGISNNESSVNAMCVHNNELYIGGNFDSVGNVFSQNIAKWSIKQ